MFRSRWSEQVERRAIELSTMLSIGKRPYAKLSTILTEVRQQGLKSLIRCSLLFLMIGHLSQVICESVNEHHVAVYKFGWPIPPKDSSNAVPIRSTMASSLPRVAICRPTGNPPPDCTLGVSPIGIESAHIAR